MSILSNLRTYLKTYTNLKTDAPIWISYLGASPTEYSIVPSPGNQIIEKYIDGSSLRTYPFAFQSVESTADDLERLENIGFYEELLTWFEHQTSDKMLPSLDEGQECISIEALGWGFLFAEGISDTGIYQVQCQLVYNQEAY